MKELMKDNLNVKIAGNRPLLGEAAAEEVSRQIRDLLKDQEYINIVFAAAPSQNEFLASLSGKEIEWDRIHAFHMDEYIGLNKNAPQLFGNYLKKRLFDKAAFRKVFYIEGNTGNPEAECKRYADLLASYPTDIVILGIGENTHLAFNDPHVADFNDPKIVKTVDLDDKNRHQQVDPADEACFRTLEEVPTHAITLTIPALMNATYAYAVVPGKNKADAIYHTLRSPVGETFPSTILRTHPQAILFIDNDSASQLG